MRRGVQFVGKGTLMMFAKIEGKYTTSVTMPAVALPLKLAPYRK